MVRDEDEYRVIEPWFLASIRKELADRIIGIFHCTVTAITRRNVDTSFGKRVGPMVGGCHELQQERFFGGKVDIGQIQRLTIKVFVSHAPGILEVNVLFLDAALINDAVTVAAEKGVHVVEVATSAIDEDAVITHAGQLLTQAGKTTLTTDAFDHRAAWRWRNGQGNGLKTTVSACTCGVEVVEVKTLFAQRIEVWRQVACVAIAAQVFGTETFDGDQYDVRRARRSWVVD